MVGLYATRAAKLYYMKLADKQISGMSSMLLCLTQLGLCGCLLNDLLSNENFCPYFL